MALTGGVRKQKPITKAVDDLGHKKTLILSEVNPETAGQNLMLGDHKRCTSTLQVAEEYKPEIEHEVNVIPDITSENNQPVKSTVKMKYWKDTTRVVDNFEADHIVLGARDGQNKQQLANQKIDNLILDNLAEIIREPGFKEALAENKEKFIAALKSELEKFSKEGE